MMGVEAYTSDDDANDRSSMNADSVEDDAASAERADDDDADVGEREDMEVEEGSEAAGDEDRESELDDDANIGSGEEMDEGSEAAGDDGQKSDLDDAAPCMPTKGEGSGLVASGPLTGREIKPSQGSLARRLMRDLARLSKALSELASRRELDVAHSLRELSQLQEEYEDCSDLCTPTFTNSCYAVLRDLRTTLSSCDLTTPPPARPRALLTDGLEVLQKAAHTLLVVVAVEGVVDMHVQWSTADTFTDEPALASRCLLSTIDNYVHGGLSGAGFETTEMLRKALVEEWEAMKVTSKESRKLCIDAPAPDLMAAWLQPQRRLEAHATIGLWTCLRYTSVLASRNLFWLLEAYERGDLRDTQLADPGRLTDALVKAWRLMGLTRDERVGLELDEEVVTAHRVSQWLGANTAAVARSHLLKWQQLRFFEP